MSIKKGSVEDVETLLAKGVNPNAFDEVHNTLHSKECLFVSKLDWIQCWTVCFYTEYDIELYALKDGKTAIMWAATIGHANVVRLLLEYRADVSLQDKVWYL